MSRCENYGHLITRTSPFFNVSVTSGPSPRTLPSSASATLSCRPVFRSRRIRACQRPNLGNMRYSVATCIRGMHTNYPSFLTLSNSVAGPPIVSSAGDVKKNEPLASQFATPEVAGIVGQGGLQVIALRAAVCPSSAGKRSRSAPDWRAPRSAWHVENAGVDEGELTIVAPPKVSVRSLLKTSDLTASQRLE